MKKSVIYKIILLLQFCCFENADAQFFGLLQKNPQNHYWTALSYPQDGKYRVLNCIQWSTQIVNYYKRCQVLIYNTNFQLIDSANLISGVTPIRSEPLKKGNRLYWAGLCYDTINPDPNIQQMVVLELDTNYHHIALHKINNPGNREILTTNVVHISNRFFVTQWDFASDSSIIYKLSDQFVKIDSAAHGQPIIEMWGIDNKLMLNVTGFQSPCYDQFGGRVEKVLLDTSFNLTSCFTYSNLGMINTGNTSQYIDIEQINTALKPLSKTKTVAIGNMPVFLQQNSKNAIVYSIIDNNNSILSKSVVISSQTNYNYIDGSNILAVKLNEILTVGCVGYNVQAVPMNQPQNTNIFVNKFDTIGNLIWQKEYGGDFYYNPTGIVFTTDGGCLISGWRYTTPMINPIPDVESFLLKLDSNGEYIADVGISENGKINQNIKCFPNPSNDKVFFDIPFQDKIEISISSTLGSEALMIRDYKNLSALDVSGFAKGVYFYKVRTKTNNYSGKFVKE